MKNTKLIEMRKKYHLTQAKVAQRAGVSISSYQRIEYGMQCPTVSVALLIAQAVNSTVEELFHL